MTDGAASPDADAPATTPDAGDAAPAANDAADAAGTADTAGAADTSDVKGDTSPDVPRETAPEAPASPARAKAITVGSSFACAILTSGDVRCWGQEVPAVRLDAGRKALAIDGGNRAVCAVLDDGSVTCWGLGSMFQVVMNPKFSPDLGGVRALAVSVGPHWACAILEDSTFRCWSSAWLSSLVPMLKSGSLPLDVSHLRSFSADYGDEIAALWDDGRVSQPLILTFAPPVLVASKPSSAISGRRTTSAFCVAYTAGGIGCTSLHDFEHIDQTTTFQALVRGDTFMCGLRPGGVVTCWNSFLPGCTDGQPDLSYWCDKPARADGGHDVALGQPAVAIAAGNDQLQAPLMCALLADGSVKCWGGTAGPCATGDGGTICQVPETPHGVVGKSVAIVSTGGKRAYGAWRAIDLDAPP